MDWQYLERKEGYVWKAMLPHRQETDRFLQPK